MIRWEWLGFCLAKRTELDERRSGGSGIQIFGLRIPKGTPTQIAPESQCVSDNVSEVDFR